MNNITPTGKIILNTIQGDLDIELFCKESPIACKNIIQNCLEGYYDNSLIYRIMPDYLIEWGLNDNTNKPNNSIYDSPFKNEYNKKLKFDKKGIVGMINDKNGLNNNNFFISLREIDYFNNKRTIVGQITGNTLYKLDNFEKQEINDKYEPLIKIRIISTKVIFHIFDDLIINSEKYTQNKKIPIKKKKINKKFKINIEEEEEDEESDENLTNIKIQNYHDKIKNDNFSTEIYNKNIKNNKNNKKINNEDKIISIINNDLEKEDEKSIEDIDDLENNLKKEKEKQFNITQNEFKKLTNELVNIKNNNENEDDNDYITEEEELSNDNQEEIENKKINKLNDFIKSVKNNSSWMSKKLNLKMDIQNFN